METTPRPGTPLRHRKLDDMRMRKFAEHTQAGTIRDVRALAAFPGRSPDTATTEERRRFQRHLVDAGTGPVTINAMTTRWCCASMRRARSSCWCARSRWCPWTPPELDLHLIVDDCVTHEHAKVKPWLLRRTG
jgi:hypothetical protein